MSGVTSYEFARRDDDTGPVNIFSGGPIVYTEKQMTRRK